MCLSGSFSHSNFFATGQQTALKNKHFFFKEDIHDYRMISGTTVEALAKIYLCHLPRAYSARFWSHPSPRLDPQHSPPVPNPAPGAAFRMGADATVGFWAAASSVWSTGPGGSALAGTSGPSCSGLRNLFYTAQCGTYMYIRFIFLYLKLWLTWTVTHSILEDRKR